MPVNKRATLSLWRILGSLPPLPLVHSFTGWPRTKEESSNSDAHHLQQYEQSATEGQWEELSLDYTSWAEEEEERDNLWINWIDSGKYFDH